MRLFIFIFLFLLSPSAFAAHKMPERTPAIFLILEHESDMRYARRLAPLCEKHGVHLTLIFY